MQFHDPFVGMGRRRRRPVKYVYAPTYVPPRRVKKRWPTRRIARNGHKGAELKFHDVDLDDPIIAAAGTITPTIIIIPQGITEVTRIGRKCVIRQVNWRFVIDVPLQTSANGFDGDVVRVILYVDKQANGATATVTNILETANFQSFNNLTNSGRFRTLFDRTYVLNVNGEGDGTANDGNVWKIRDAVYKKVNLPIEYSAAAGTIDEIRSNNIGVLLISESGVAGFKSKFRMRFSDV